jgi:glutathione S-transferase
LEVANIPYREDAHAPVFHIPYVKAAGAGRTVPVLVADRVISDSTEILQWIGAHPASTWDPYPVEDALAWEERFDEKLGPHARRLAYGLLLPHKSLVMTMMNGNGRSLESRAIDIGFPAVAAALRKSLNITPDSLERSKARLWELMDDVGRALDGREYLCGDSFTSADLTFASLAAPLVLPEGYGWTMPTLADLPEDVRAEIDAFREHPAGQHVLDIYAKHRGA